MTLPRRLISPSTPPGMLGALVIVGVLLTSRTLNTLMPKVSWVPSENSRISMRFDPASLVRASTLSISDAWSGQLHLTRVALMACSLASGGRGQSVRSAEQQAAQRFGQTLRLELRHILIDADRLAQLLVRHARTATNA